MLLCVCSLKPQNVLLRTSRRDKRGYSAKVSDFGLAQWCRDGSKVRRGVHCWWRRLLRWRLSDRFITRIVVLHALQDACCLTGWRAGAGVHVCRGRALSRHHLRNNARSRVRLTWRACACARLGLLQVSVDSEHWGTVVYAAPEVFSGSLSKASDVWSYGERRLCSFADSTMCRQLGCLCSPCVAISICLASFHHRHATARMPPLASGAFVRCAVGGTCNAHAPIPCPLPTLHAQASCCGRCAPP